MPPSGAGPSLDTNPATLHQTRRAIDGMLQGEQDGNVKRVLSQVRAELDAIPGDAVPDIKRIDAQYAELGRQRSAVERGQTVLDNGREAPRPAELRDEVAAGAVPSGDVVGPSGVAFRLSQGARAEIDRLVGTKLNDRAALNSVLKGESDWTYDRLSTRKPCFFRVEDRCGRSRTERNRRSDRCRSKCVSIGWKPEPRRCRGESARQVTGGISAARREAMHEKLAQELVTQANPPMIAT